MVKFKAIDPLVTKVRQNALDSLIRANSAYRAYNEARTFIRDNANSVEECEKRLAAFKADYADCGSYPRLLQECFDHAMTLRSYPQFDETTPREIFNGETLFVQAEDRSFHGGLVTETPQANNAVSQTIRYTHAFSGKQYKLEAYAWEFEGRVYNAVYLDSVLVSAYDYTMTPNHHFYLSSSEKALLVALDTGLNYVWAQVGALPF
jgi:hypothetical protein